MTARVGQNEETSASPSARLARSAAPNPSSAALRPEERQGDEQSIRREGRAGTRESLCSSIRASRSREGRCRVGVRLRSRSAPSFAERGRSDVRDRDEPGDPGRVGREDAAVARRRRRRPGSAWSFGCVPPFGRATRMYGGSGAPASSATSIRGGSPGARRAANFAPRRARARRAPARGWSRARRPGREADAPLRWLGSGWLDDVDRELLRGACSPAARRRGQARAPRRGPWREL